MTTRRLVSVDACLLLPVLFSARERVFFFAFTNVARRHEGRVGNVWMSRRRSYRTVRRMLHAVSCWLTELIDERDRKRSRDLFCALPLLPASRTTSSPAHIARWIWPRGSNLQERACEATKPVVRVNRQSPQSHTHSDYTVSNLLRGCRSLHRLEIETRSADGIPNLNEAAALWDRSTAVPSDSLMNPSRSDNLSDNIVLIVSE